MYIPYFTCKLESQKKLGSKNLGLGSLEKLNLGV